MAEQVCGIYIKIFHVIESASHTNPCPVINKCPRYSGIKCWEDPSHCPIYNRIGEDKN